MVNADLTTSRSLPHCVKAWAAFSRAVGTGTGTAADFTDAHMRTWQPL